MKTIILATAIVILSLISTLICSQTCYRGNSIHSGYYEGSGPGENPKIAWKFKTNEKVFSSPVIYKNVVFIGSNDSCLYALDETNGHLHWKFKTGGCVSSSAAVFNNVVFINSFDGYIYALNTKNGKMIWKYNMGEEKVFKAKNLHGIKTNGKIVEDPWDMYLSSPIAGNGKVYIGSGNGNFFALDAKNGQLIWQFKTNGVIHSSPAISGDSVYFASWDSYIYALNANNGKEFWRFKTNEDTINFNQVGFQSSPSIFEKVLFIGCRDANMRAIDRFTGKLIWSYSTKGSWIISAPAVYHNKVYFGTSDSHRILSLVASTGEVIFDRSAKTYVFSSPAIANNKLFIGTLGGFLYRMDCNSGDTRPIFRTDLSAENSKIYFNSDSTFISERIFKELTVEDMYKATDRLYSMGSILSSPAVSGKRIYFGSTDGYVYALE